MVTVSSPPSNLDTSVDIETETDYLKVAKKGGGRKGQRLFSANRDVYRSVFMLCF